MARAFSLALVLVASSSFGQSFGRFGYQPLADVPGFEVTRQGVRARQPMANMLRFPDVGVPLEAKLTDRYQQVVARNAASGGPSKLRSRLYSRSLDLYFANGLRLDLSCVQSPFLSWKEGSVADDVPTPDLPWTLLSFRDSQPPIVLGFGGQTASLKITGGPGGWHLISPRFKGWLRLMLPLGTDGKSANTAGTLGRLYNLVAKESSQWSSPTPNLVGERVTADENGVDGRWAFDAPGAIVPSAIAFAESGGYPIRVTSAFHRADRLVDRVPVDILDGKTLDVRFPVRQIPLGRALGIGPDPRLPIQSISYIDVPSVADLGVECLLASAEETTFRIAHESYDQFISESSYFPETFTGQRLPFSADGTGLDVTAAHALLLQCLGHAEGREDANPLLESALLKMDGASWMLMASSKSLSRRATALAAVTCALSQSPAKRLQAGMLAAGLAGESGWRTWAYRRGLEALAPVENAGPAFELRGALFSLKASPTSATSFLALLRSPSRVLSLGSFEASGQTGTVSLSWISPSNTPRGFDLLLPEGSSMRPGTNLSFFRSHIRPNVSSYEFTAEISGKCTAWLKLPQATTLPRWVAPPRYSE